MNKKSEIRLVIIIGFFSIELSILFFGLFWAYYWSLIVTGGEWICMQSNMIGEFWFEFIGLHILFVPTIITAVYSFKLTSGIRLVIIKFFFLFELIILFFSILYLYYWSLIVTNGAWICLRTNPGKFWFEFIGFHILCALSIIAVLYASKLTKN